VEEGAQVSMVLITALLALVLFAWYLSFSAGRLDRLHHRVETSWEHLDALLQRRAALALEISHQSELDPATQYLLVQSAYVSREESIAERSDAEKSLAHSLAFLKDAATGGEFDIPVSLLSELTSISEKIAIATQIHLEAVSSVEKMRVKFIYKFFRLAGRAKLPLRYSFETDSE